MKPIIAALLLFICIASLSGCGDDPEPSNQTPAEEPNMADSNPSGPGQAQSDESPAKPPSDTFQISGTVVYKDIEGGFFAIDAEDGSKYDPINLPEAFRKDGLKVKATVRLEPEVMSAHMYGSVINILDIARQ